ncbi:MAG: AI-2E family transporter [Janthinobacterium lividum]
MSLQRQLLIWIAMLALAVLALYTLSGVLAPFLAGITVAYFLDPLACKLERLGLNRLGATALIMLLSLAVVLVVLVLLLPILAHQLTSFVINLPGIAAKLQDLLIAQGAALVETYGGETLRKLGVGGPITSADVQGSLGSVVGQATNYAIGFVNSIWSGSRALFGLFSLLVITPVVAFYILLDWRRMIGAIDGWVPIHQRDIVRAIARDIDRALAGFVRGQTIVSLILGAWYATGLTMAGLNFGFLLGIAGGFFSFVPYFGSLTVLIVATAVATVQSWPDWHLIAMVAGTVMAGQVLEGYVLGPYLVGNSIGLHPVWLMFSLVVCSALFGVAGLLVAVPLSAAVGVLSRFALRRYLQSPLYTGEEDGPVAVAVTFEPRIVEAGRD